MSSGRDEIVQEFYNNADHQELLLYNPQQTGTVINSLVGAYGRVEKVRYSRNIYAGKFYHESIFEKTLQYSKIIVNDFVKEFKKICSIHHPNLVEAIGTMVVPTSIMPILVSEHLEHDLHQYLLSSPNMALVLKQSILEDISKGLLFLHSMSPVPLIHRDLTAHNVVLTASLVAKISDYANSALLDLTSLECPTSDNKKLSVYMPPECDDDSKKKSASLDIFSFGHIILFCCIQTFPDNLLPTHFTPDDHPEWIMGQSEVDRRREYFKLMDLKLPHGNKHPLYSLAQDCLHNDPVQRPMTQDVSARLHQMVEDAGRIPDDGETLDRMDVINLIQQQNSLNTLMPKEKEEYHARLESCEAEKQELLFKIEEMKAQYSETLKEKESLIDEKNVMINEMEKQVEKLDAEKNTTVLRFQEIIRNIKQIQEEERKQTMELKDKEEKLRQEEDEVQQKSDKAMAQVLDDIHITISPVNSLPSSPRRKSKILDLNWDQLPDLPVSFPNYIQAVYHQGKIYVGGSSEKEFAYTIYTYDTAVTTLPNESQQAWTPLPQKTPRREFGMAVVKDMLIIVGGIDSSNKKSKKIGLWDETVQKWKDNFYPSLQTARSSPVVIVHDNKWVVVVGGYTTDKPTNTIEKLDVDSHKAWSVCAPFPEKCFNLSYAIVRSELFIAGTIWGGEESSKVVYSTPLVYLIHVKNETKWKPIPSIPNASSTIISLPHEEDVLLAVGGEVSLVSTLAKRSPIYSCVPKRDSGSIKWESVGSLPCERSCCFCLPLPGQRVVILGGTQLTNQEGVRRVDVGTFSEQDELMSTTPYF